MVNKKILINGLLLTALITSCAITDVSTNPNSTNSESEASQSSQGTSQSTSQASDSEVSSIETPSISGDNTPKKTGYSLLWNDEFDGDSLDKSNWEPMRGNGDDYGIPGWGNSEKQFYTSSTDNVDVEDGTLVITAIKENKSNFNYTSARLRTYDKVYTTYGYIEARIKLPEVQGLWPAFWMLPETPSPYGGWPGSGEIDIMEARGRNPGEVSSALHFGGTGPNGGGNHNYKSNNYYFKDSTIGEYHTYAVDWQPGIISFLVDDEVYYTLEADPRFGWYSGSDGAADKPNAPFDRDFHILLNLAVGGHFDNHILPGADFEYASMFVDYVRIFEKNR